MLAFSVRRGLASNTTKITRQTAEHNAREIGPEHETEMKGSSVEDRRTIELDVKCYADHDDAIAKARYSSDKKLPTNLSSASCMPLLKDPTIFGGRIMECRGAAELETHRRYLSNSQTLSNSMNSPRYSIAYIDVL